MQDAHPKVESGCFGVMGIFVIFGPAQISERRKERKEGREACWQWGISKDSCERTCRDPSHAIGTQQFQAAF